MCSCCLKKQTDPMGHQPLFCENTIAMSHQRQLPKVDSAGKTSGNEEVREMVDDYIRKVCQNSVQENPETNAKEGCPLPPRNK